MAKRFNENIDLLRADSQKEYERLYNEYMPYIYMKYRRALALKNQIGYNKISELEEEFITFYNDCWIAFKENLHKFNEKRGTMLNFFLFGCGKVIAAIIYEKNTKKRIIRFEEENASDFIRLANEEKPEYDMMEEMNLRISKLPLKKQEFLKYFMQKKTRKTPLETQTYADILIELKTGKTRHYLNKEKNAIKNK